MNEEFQELRRKVNDCVNRQRALGEPGKFYEGEWEIVLYYDGADEDPQAAKGPRVTIKLHCYLIGPGRHYEWKGQTFREAFNKCRNDVLMWIAEAYDEMEEGYG